MIVAGRETPGERLTVIEHETLIEPPAKAVHHKPMSQIIHVLGLCDTKVTNESEFTSEGSHSLKGI